MLFERSCPACGSDARTVCEHCLAQLRAAGPVRVEGAAGSGAAFVYCDVGAALILAGKNGGRRDVLRHLARSLVGAIPQDAQAITWVPAATENRRKRGYDQGRVIAGALARQTQLPARQLLRRTVGTSQIGHNRSQRWLAPGLEAVCGQWERVLVVDDVMTTGSSLTRAVVALKSVGVTRVWTLTLAAVP